MNNFLHGRPDSTEYPPYAAAYVSAVAADDVLGFLDAQLDAVHEMLAPVNDARAATFAYAPGKWTIKQIVGHITDTERVFAYRALRFARNDTTNLPGFEQDDFVRYAASNDRSLTDLLNEFRTVRLSTLVLYRSLSPEAWTRRGVSNNHPTSVRGIVFLTAGHVEHHLRILREKYLG
jgi:DinB superfamily